MSSELALLPAALGGLVGWAAQRLKRHQKVRVIHARPELDDDTIYQAYYGRSGLPRNAVCNVWHEVADTLRLPAGKLRPSDRFGPDIGRFVLLSNELDTLYEPGARRARRLGLTPNFEAMKTVDDYVRVLSVEPAD